MKRLIYIAFLLGCQTVEVEPIDNHQEDLFFKAPEVTRVTNPGGMACNSHWQCIDPQRQDCVDGTCRTVEANAHGFVQLELHGEMQYIEQSYKGYWSTVGGTGLSLDLGSFANSSRLQFYIPGPVVGDKKPIEYVDLELGDNLTKSVNGYYYNEQTISTILDERHGYLYGKMYNDNGDILYTQLTWEIR